MKATIKPPNVEIINLHAEVIATIHIEVAKQEEKN